MMDFNERVIPGVSANFLYQEALARYEFALKYIKPGDKILDVGCGTGYGAAILGRYAKVIGIDSERQAIEYARQKYHEDAKFRIGDAEELNFDDKFFEIAISFEVIEHLKSPQKFLDKQKVKEQREL